MSKSKILMLVMFVVTLGAGASAGMLYERRDLACNRSTQTMVQVQQLNLTPEQQAKFVEIMAPVTNAHRQRKARKDDFIKEKDAATLTILNPEQKQKFAEIQKKYDDQIQELDQKVKRAEDDAAAAVGGILNEQQRAKYIELQKARDEADLKSKSK